MPAPSASPEPAAGSPAGSTAEPGAARSPRVAVVVAVLAFGGIVASLMQTLVIPLVTELPVLLHTSASGAAWVLTAPLLAGGVATPVLGRLGDMYGKRRMLLTSVGLLIAGSVVSGASSTLAPMVVGRTLQGISLGVIPLGISIMRDELPAERLGAAVALMSASMGVGGALGLPAAAFIAQHADWHTLFWTAAGLGAVVAVLVLTFVPESAVRSGGRFDVPGAVGLSVGLLCLLLAISKGADWGWGSARTGGLFAAAVVVLLVWARWELRRAQPLVDLRTAGRRQVLLTNLASVVFGFAMFAMSLVVPQLLELPRATGYGLGQTVLVAGLCLGPSGLVMMAMAPISARITATAGPRTTLMAGAVVIATGYGMGIALMSAVWQLILVSAVVSAGIGLAYAAMPSLIMSAVPPGETAAANSLNSLMRAFGTSVASAVAGVILAHMTVRFGAVAVPTLNGFRTVMAVGSGAALFALAVASFLPRRPKPTVDEEGPSRSTGSPATTQPVR